MTAPFRTRLLHAASTIALMASAPASAGSLAALRAAAGFAPGAAATAPSVVPAGGGSVLSAAQTAALARSSQSQARVLQAASLAQQAQAAARASVRASNVPNGLVAGGLVPVANPVVSALDPTGLHTWQGASQPTQTTNGGAVNVTVTQTQSRAVLSWQSFNVGENTTLNFDQKVNGVAQKDWVALNRVVGGLDPATGRRNPNATPSPSQILGHIKADGTVLIINQAGVLFGPKAQVNTHSLIVSSLEVGRARALADAKLTPINIRQRNEEFLTYGLLGVADQASKAEQPQIFTFSAQAVDATADDPLREGDVRIEAGGQITADDAGTILLAAPTVVNAGSLSAVDGQISLQSGRRVRLTRSEGTATSADPLVRGLIVTSEEREGDPADFVWNMPNAIIASRRGYLSIGSTARGATLEDGTLSSTTSVSRNGYVSLTGGTIRVGPGASIAITPDDSRETIPQAPSSVAAFKTSRVVVGDASADIDIAANSTIYAPGGNVLIGAPAGIATLVDDPTDGATPRVFVDAGALIDVGGLKDVGIDASRNAIRISPVKGNELRDTPTYRDSFLNGATVTVDPRLSGVRADGVAWVGSPLIEAASYYSQVGVSAAELLTKGGNVSIGVPSYGAGGNPATAPDVIIKAGATIDFSGGWVRYQAGSVTTSRLVTAAGTIVDIGAADPNETYIGLLGGFTQSLTRIGESRTFTSPVLAGTRAEAAYTEGRDAGSLTIKSSALALDGTVHGDAFAGSLQKLGAATGTGKSAIYGDVRAMQAAPSQLPTGGYLNIQAIGISTVDQRVTGGGDVRVTSAAAVPTLGADFHYGQDVTIGADGLPVVPARDAAALLPDSRRDTLFVSADTLNAAGLGEIALGTSGSVTIDAGTTLATVPGGAVTIAAGRRIDIDGAIVAPGGRIDLATYETLVGSAFADDPAVAGAFDIRVTGTLSAAGRFVNDFGATADTLVGNAYTRGGSVSLTVAPRVSVVSGDDTSTDVSGSILLEPGSLVDVSGGGHVGVTGAVETAARGGDLSLVDQTNYFQISPTPVGGLEAQGNVPGFRVTGNPGLQYARNPASINATVTLGGTIRAAGFGGGGSLSLETPAIVFGNGPVATGTALPLDFFSRTGFADYAITSYGTALVANHFDNGLGGTNAVLATQTLVVGNGQTLDLTQSRFSPILDPGKVAALHGLATGGSLYNVLVPAVDAAPFDQLGAGLTLAGLTELDVAVGGRVTGAAGASLTVSKLLDQGSIRLVGGRVTQSEVRPDLYIGALGVHDLSNAFTTDADGTIREDAANAAGVRDASGALLTNRQLALEPIYLLGTLEATDGINIANGGSIDVSGASLRDSRIVQPVGVAAPLVSGRIIGGGTIETLPAYAEAGAVLTRPTFGEGVFNSSLISTTGSRAATLMTADAGASINLSGAADTYSQASANGYLSRAVWSAGGRLALGNGGTILGADIAAFGGAPAAAGGTLELLDPVLVATAPAAPTINRFTPGTIEAAGFDSLTAYGSLGATGDVSLTLRDAFTLASRRYDGSIATTGRYEPTVSSTGNLQLSAAHVLLDGLLQAIPSPITGIAGTGTVRLSGGTIDVRGSVLFDRSVADVAFDATGAMRLTGAAPYQQTLGLDTSQVTPSLAGQILVNGNIAITAAQLYPTTGSSFLVASAGANATIAVSRTAGTAAATPYSAGGDMLLQAAHIVQGGTVRVPIGSLRLGSSTASAYAPATQTVELLAGSITSVSANGLSIPYGVTTDQTEYFFAPTSGEALTAPPAGALDIAGGSISLDSGATVDISGGGDLYAYEFVPGTGGSRDVLDRFNTDPYSSNAGYQYPDRRQVYAVVPNLEDSAAAYDPIYSADYSDLYGSDVGRRVHLDGTAGLAAGWYTLLPAKYAMLPGGYRIVEQTGVAAVAGVTSGLKDGSGLTTGYYGTAGTDIAESALRTFSVQGQDVFRRYSNIVLTSADATFAARAARDGLASPRLPTDSGRLILEPAQALALDGTLSTAPAKGGRGARIDIAGDAFRIVSADSDAAVPDGTIRLDAGRLTALTADSLLIGGRRSDQADGTTALDVTARRIDVANDAAHPLNVPELLLAVDGDRAAIDIADGAAVIASGTLSDPSVADYTVARVAGGDTAQGAFVRVADGPERLLSRLTPGIVATAPDLTIGAATISGTSVLLDSSGNSAIDATATLHASDLALGASAVSFGSGARPGLVIAPALAAGLASVGQLSLRTPGGVGFEGGDYAFGNLVVDASALASLDGAPVRVTAASVTLGNRAPATPVACAADCGAATLSLTADAIGFDGGTVVARGFGGGVALATSKGITYQGKGGFDAGGGALSLSTPFVADAAVPIVPGKTQVLPSLSLTSTGAITFAKPAGTTATAAAGTPGATLSINGASVAVDGTALRATAGKLAIRATGDIFVDGQATLATPGYARAFGDAADSYSVSAPGGVLSLVSTGGNVSLGTGSTLSVGGGQGTAGTLVLSDPTGTLSLAGTIDASAPSGGGSLTIDTGGAFDLDRFAADSRGFDGAIAIHAGSGDLFLGAGRTLRASQVRLATEDGAVAIAGTIDTHGVEGGDVGLFGGTGVRLVSGARIDAHADGYAATDTRPASGGDVTLGTGDAGAVSVDAGATIDVGARRTGDRLVAMTRNAETDYTLVESDEGGTLTLRAPIVEQTGADTVHVIFAGQVLGADAIVLSAYKRFDLATIAADPRFAGVAIANGTATLDVGAAVGGRVNVLADDADGTIPRYIRAFDVTGANAALGNLARDPAFVARPEVELDYAGSVRLASNWNLGAGTVDVAGAVAAGVMTPSSKLAGRFLVVAGREGELLENFTDMTYRVGGRIAGAPAMLTIRAGGDLDVRGVVTDGFFNFRDQTDSAYLTSVVGGDASVYKPTVQTTCVPGNCTVVPAYAFNRTQAARVLVDLSKFGVRRVGGGVVKPTPLPDNIPFSQAANSAVAAGGDAPGGAELFPLLSDGGFAGSTSYMLAAGAADSVDPLRADPAATGNLTVSGERSYKYGGSSSSYAPGVTLSYATKNVTLADLLEVIRGTFPRAKSDANTSIALPTGNTALAKLLRQRAQQFIATHPGKANTFGPTATPSALVTSLTLADEFLTDVQNAVADAVTDPTSGVLPPLTGSGQTTATVRNYVRTGTGSIAMAAAGDIDLRDGAKPRYTNSLGAASTAASGYQVGGSAVFTAGHTAMPGTVNAIDQTGATRAVDASGAITRPTDAGEVAAFTYGTGTQTALRGLLVANPVYAEGGGDVSATAGGDVLSRRDVSLEQRLVGAPQFNFIGAADQPWRVGSVGTTTNLRIVPALFTSGIAALGGGSVSVSAGGDISDLTVSALTSATTGAVAAREGDLSATPTLRVMGGGDVTLTAGAAVLGGRVDIGRGVARITAGDIAAAAALVNAAAGTIADNTFRLRLSDATASLTSLGALRIAGIAALGATQASSNPTGTLDGRGFYSDAAAVDLLANAGVTVDNRGDDVTAAPLRLGVARTAVYPGTVEAASLTGDISITPDRASADAAAVVDLVPDADGQLRLLAAGSIGPATIAMDDRDPGQLPGVFSIYSADASGALLAGQDFGFPAVLPDTPTTERLALHNVAITHRADAEPVRVAAGGDIAGLILATPKQARVSAGRDITDMMFFGQNLTDHDITRIVAGRDIVATTRLVRADLPDGTSGAPLSALQGNNFVIGGPGMFMLEAGRDAGPFLTSAVADPRRPRGDDIGFQGAASYGGGILSVGNEDNPSLSPAGASLVVQFGVAKGADYDALATTYLDPANVAKLPDELFGQTLDANGNRVADRSKPIYGPILIAWMKAHRAETLDALYGTTDVDWQRAYDAFRTLPALSQRSFLIEGVYFNELRQTSVPSSPSYLKYARGYRAVNLLFPATLGYTANSLDGGASGAAETIATGNLDLRLATIQTSRGGDIAILGPGGTVLGGSTVRTSDQASRRTYDGARLYAGDRPAALLANGNPALGFSQIAPARVQDIPSGFEGILTLRGGEIDSFTDGDLRLNQSRLFTESGGNITLWSSNGDLNAGQGPKTSANFPPVAVRIDQDGFSEVDAVGGVSGAGIAAFEPAPGTPAPDVYLIAPRGTVDAGDAGVRVAGSLFIAAAAVANADNFKVGGQSFGIPSVTTVDAGATAAASAASAAAQQLANQAANQGTDRDQLSRISVDVLGFAGDGNSCDRSGPRPQDCPPRK